MTIAELREKNKVTREAAMAWAKSRLEGVPKDVLALGIIILASSASFGLGMLVERDMGQGGAFQVPEPLTKAGPAAVGAVTTGGNQKTSEVTASKNGSKYYYPWCSGISKISSQNRVVFSSATEAEARGYELAGTCK